MSTGIIKTKVVGKDFGFITPDDQQPGDKDVFFHREFLVDVTMEELEEGKTRVSYDTEPSDKPDRGPKAVNVRKI